MSRARPVALLDVNVLLALFDPAHIHHEIAHDWFAQRGSYGWATCPLTENGFLRNSAAASKTKDPMSVAEIVEALQTFTAHSRHHFWADEISLLDEKRFTAELVLGHQQLTDVYLLGLAVKHQAVLATFDRKIPLAAVKGAKPQHVEVLGALE